MRRSDRLNRSSRNVSASEDRSAVSATGSSFLGHDGDEISIAIDDPGGDGDPSSELSFSASASSDMKRRRRVLICRNPVAAVSLTKTFLSSFPLGSGGDLAGGPLSELGLDSYAGLTASPRSGPQRFCSVLEHVDALSDRGMEAPQFKLPFVPTKRSHNNKSRSISFSSSLASSPSRIASPPPYAETAATANQETSPRSKRKQNRLQRVIKTDDDDELFPSDCVLQQRTGDTLLSFDAETEGLLAGAKYLTNWVPRLYGRKFIVEGDLLNFNNTNPNPIQDRWKTSKVCVRKKSNLVLTSKSSAYVLEGKLNFKYALEYNTPQFVIQAFLYGFPDNWETYRDQWRLFLKDQMLNSNASSISLASSMGDKSAFVPRLSAIPLLKIRWTEVERAKEGTVLPKEPKQTVTKDKGQMLTNEVSKEDAAKKEPSKVVKMASTKATSDVKRSRGRPKKNVDTNCEKDIAERRKRKPSLKQRLIDEETVKSSNEGGSIKRTSKKGNKGAKANGRDPVKKPTTKVTADGEKEKKKRGRRLGGGKVISKPAKEIPHRKAPLLPDEAEHLTSISTSPFPVVRLKRLEECPDLVAAAKPVKRAITSKKGGAKAPTIPKPTQLVPNPRTIRERRINSAILQDLNKNHDDDFFQAAQGPSHQPLVVATAKAAAELRPSDIVHDLFDSDSENDISIHSSRTPIGNYMLRSSRSQTPVPAASSGSHECSREGPDRFEEPVNLGFKDHAFIHRKVQESRRTHKLFGTKVKSPQLFALQAPFGRDIPCGRGLNIAEPVARMMNEVSRANHDDDDSDQYPEPYFDDDKESMTGSIVQVPMGLMDAYQRESALPEK